MELALVARPILLLTITFGATIFITSLFSDRNLKPSSSAYLTKPQHPTTTPTMSRSNRSFILWLHGLGDSGPANEPIKTFFTSPEFNIAKWSFPSAPANPVSCNDGHVMPSWFDIHEIPVTSHSPKDENGVLKAVKNVHSMIDKEIAAGISPDNVFICGFSQGGALTLASVLLYPKALGGGAIFSGWVPFNDSIIEQIPEDAKKTPILWSHGVVDNTVLFEAGQAGPPFLNKVGFSSEFKAYPGLGHSISDQELKYLESWIKSRLGSSSK